MNKREKNQWTHVGTIFAFNLLFSPILLAGTAPNTISAAGIRASLTSVNAKVENKFIQKKTRPTSTHDLKDYESEPIIFGTFQRQKTDVSANINGYHIKSGGVGYLLDYNFKTALDLFEIGGGATYAESHTNIATSDTLNSDYGQILGYANLVENGYFLGLFLSGTESWSKSKRAISGTTLQALSRFKGAAFFSKVRIGHMSRQSDWQLIPEASLYYVHFHESGRNETGADISNLSVSSSAADGVKAGIGGRVMYIQPAVTTEIRAFYLRDLKNPLLNPSFTFSASGAPFASSAQNNKKNNLNLGASLKYFVRPDLSITGVYDFLVKQQGYTENNASLLMCWNF